MAMRIQHNWILRLAVRNGHRYFEDDSTGRIAVADGSGSTPDQTDDGILWLDKNSPIEWSHGDVWDIPLVRPDGEVCSTYENMPGAFEVAEKFGMVMTYGTDGREYVMTRQVKVMP